MLREQLGIETTLVKGRSGIFTVTVNGAVVTKKTWNGFPSEDEILSAVRVALKEV